MSDYERRFDAAQTELDTVGIWPSNGVPPYVRAMRGMGMSPIPPHYLPVWKSVIGQGVFFTVVWGLFMYVMIWAPSGTPFGTMVTSTLVAGTFFGGAMGLYYFTSRRRYKLSRWEDL